MADSSKDIQLRELKDMINDLKKMIKTLQATVDAANKREEALTQERDNLKEEIDLLRKKLFGTSSEKRTLDIPGQLNFFNEAELEQDPEAAKAEDLETILPEKTAKKRKARATDAERFKGVPVEKKYLELSEEEKLCPVCGTPLKEIGEEFVRRELVFVPAKLKVYEYYSKSYGIGVYRSSDGYKLDGVFTRNKFTDGFLEFTKSGNTYQYEVANGKFTKQITIKYKNGCRYTGTYSKTKLTGKGTISYKNGDKYTGEIQNGKKYGTGTYRWKSGVIYKGSWKKDRMSGKGTYYYPSKSKGKKLTGTFKNNQPTGTCVYVARSGSKYKTTWSKGKCTKVERYS